MPRLRKAPVLRLTFAALSRLAFRAGERAMLGLAVLALGFAIPLAIDPSVAVVKAEGSASAPQPDSGTLSQLWSDMTWLPTQMDHALGGMMGPNGIILATVTLFALPLILLALLLLHKRQNRRG